MRSARIFSRIATTRIGTRWWVYCVVDPARRCSFALPLHLTIDNDVKFVRALYQSLWNLCWTKLRFTSSYNPQSDPAERANRQVLEALRAAVATVVQYNEWDEALPHVTFGLNTHVSTIRIMGGVEGT